MSIATLTRPQEPAWSRVCVGSCAVAAADRDALGTTARLVVWPPANLPRVLAVVDAVLARLDKQASRFRPDSEISALHDGGPGSYLISEGLAEAIGIALAAARWTGGLSDPTVGGALISLGYDRDFAEIGQRGVPGGRPPETAQRGVPGGRPPGTAQRGVPAQNGDLAACGTPVPGWQTVRLSGYRLTLPAGVRLDLGATAKGLGADRAARAAHAAANDGGVLVSLGGDVAVAGMPPTGGWPLLIADEHRQVRSARNLAVQAARSERRSGQPAPGKSGPAQARPGPARARSGPAQAAGRADRAGQPPWPAGPPAEADPVTAQQIRLSGGGLATSSITCRQWERAGRLLHHIIDPRTGMPAEGPWRTVSVAAASCAEANAAATAAIIAGEAAQDWLTAQGLPARLVGHDGSIRLTGGWPAADGGRVDPPRRSLLPAGRGPERRRP